MDLTAGMDQRLLLPVGTKMVWVDPFEHILEAKKSNSPASLARIRLQVKTPGGGVP